MHLNFEDMRIDLSVANRHHDYLFAIEEKVDESGLFTDEFKLSINLYTNKWCGHYIESAKVDEWGRLKLIIKPYNPHEQNRPEGILEQLGLK